MTTHTSTPDRGPYPYQFASMAKRRQYRGMDPDSLTGEQCPCRQCHPSGGVALTVYEAMMGLCSVCLMRLCGQMRVMSVDEQSSRRRAVLADCGVPVAYRGMTWDAWTGQAPDGRLTGWQGAPWCVWIFGPAGTGKTHLAVAMLAEFELERGVRFAVASELLESLKAGFDGGDHRAMAEVRRCRLLVLDDAFTGKESEKWGRPTLCDILRARHANNAATIVTSNVPPSKVAEFDVPLASRLGEGLRVNMTSVPDYRQRGGQRVSS